VQRSVMTSGAGVADEQVSFADPVFVLCHGRSGSTLLRFLLDAHPELACPPETNLPSLCAQLATVWSLIEGAPLSVNRGDEPPSIPDAAIAGIRQTMDRMIGSYLTRRGKLRYCDKSLGTARFVELLLRIYPQARFLCLYRHPMDVIASGLEACPWGLNGYGFEPYIATTPGNAVMALARFWADNAAATLAAEEQFAERCLRIRYEDLVTDPEGTAAGVFRFLDAAMVPGLSTTCFSSERERFGPADYKIWSTSRVSPKSIGRGWSVPSAIIAPQVLAGINEIAAKLGYLQVDGEWGTSAPPADLRVAIAPGSTSLKSSPAVAPEQSRLLRDRLEAGLADVWPQIASRCQAHATESFVAVWIPEEPGRQTEHWLVNLDDRSVTFAGPAAQEKSNWDVVGSSGAWQQVIDGRLNLNVALRACQLRYCDDDEPSPLVSEARVGILARLLGLTNW